MDDAGMAILRGAVEVHAHAGPDKALRRQDMLDLARNAAQAGMKAVAVKSHWTISSDCAYLVNRMVGGVTMVGGITLNRSVGGLNPEAVRAAVWLGAKVVWMPSLDAAWTVHRLSSGERRVGIYQAVVNIRDDQRGICVLKDGLEGSELLPEVIEILKMVAENDLCLDTSHLSPKECLILVEEARKIGVKRISCSHINSAIIGATLNEQKQLADLGAFLVYCIGPCMPGRGGQSPAEIGQMIRAVGVEKSVISTDAGPIENPPMVEGLRMFVMHLLVKEGFSQEEIDLMLKRNPSYLLNIHDAP